MWQSHSSSVAKESNMNGLDVLVLVLEHKHITCAMPEIGDAFSLTVC